MPQIWIWCMKIENTASIISSIGWSQASTVCYMKIHIFAKETVFNKRTQGLYPESSASAFACMASIGGGRAGGWWGGHTVLAHAPLQLAYRASIGGGRAGGWVGWGAHSPCACPHASSELRSCACCIVLIRCLWIVWMKLCPPASHSWTGKHLPFAIFASQAYIATHETREGTRFTTRAIDYVHLPISFSCIERCRTSLSRCSRRSRFTGSYRKQQYAACSNTGKRDLDRRAL